MIFDQVTRALFPVILLVSLYITLRGHNAPGGGFAGGLIAGIAFAMRFLAGGSPRLRRAAPCPPRAWSAVGLLLAVASGLVPLLFGSEFLDGSIAHQEVPIIGEVELVSAAVVRHRRVRPRPRRGPELPHPPRGGGLPPAPLGHPHRRPRVRGDLVMSERSVRARQHRASDGGADGAVSAGPGGGRR